MHDDLTIDRHVDLDVDLDAAVELATTPDGWRSWLVDEAELAPAADGTERGTVVDDGIERVVRVDERTDRAVRFTWWEASDPDGASEVVIRVHPTDGGTRVEIGERRLPASSVRASLRTASPIAGAGLVRWQVRACLLSVACTSLVRA